VVQAVSYYEVPSISDDDDNDDDDDNKEVTLAQQAAAAAVGKSQKRAAFAEAEAGAASPVRSLSNEAVHTSSAAVGVCQTSSQAAAKPTTLASLDAAGSVDTDQGAEQPPQAQPQQSQQELHDKKAFED
jgi:hypothetical protein